MVQGWIWKRAAALLAAAGLFAFLVGGISADDGNTEAVAARALKPTQAIADVPAEFNELFQIQWGGGSLYHLKARLATMGCMLNTIWVYDDNEWYAYNQYNVPTQLNTQFLNKFKDNIPATTLYATCIYICPLDIDYGNVVEGGECKQWEDILELWIQQKEEIIAGGGLTIDDDAICNDDFNPIVKEKVFSLLPILLDTCIVRQTDLSIENNLGGVYGGHIVLWSNPANYIDREETLRILLHTEIHELCHIQQTYYLVQKAFLNQELHIEIDNYYTQANKEFMDIVGFTEPTQWNFQLSENSIFKEIYSTNPIELSAELCTLYLLEKIGEKSIYVNNKNFNPQKYLTPQVVEWLEKYMVLPYPNYESE